MERIPRRVAHSPSHQARVPGDRCRRRCLVLSPFSADGGRRPEGPHLDRPALEPPRRSRRFRNAAHHPSGEEGVAPLQKPHGKDHVPAPEPADPVRNIQDHYDHDAAQAPAYSDPPDTHADRRRTERRALARRPGQAPEVLAGAQLHEDLLSGVYEHGGTVLVVRRQLSRKNSRNVCSARLCRTSR
jgi:hypothetical protein